MSKRSTRAGQGGPTAQSKYLDAVIRWKPHVSRRTVDRIEDLCDSVGSFLVYRDGVAGSFDKWPRLGEIKVFVEELREITGRELLGVLEPRGWSCAMDDCDCPGTRARGDVNSTMCEPEYVDQALTVELGERRAG